MNIILLYVVAALLGFTIVVPPAIQVFNGVVDWLNYRVEYYAVPRLVVKDRMATSWQYGDRLTTWYYYDSGMNGKILYFIRPKDSDPYKGIVVEEVATGSFELRSYDCMYLDNLTVRQGAGSKTTVSYTHLTLPTSDLV